jgi:hypothetical protein
VRTPHALHPRHLYLHKGQILVAQKWAVVPHKRLQHPLFFTCIAPDGCTLTGSYGIDRRVVLVHGAPAVLTLPLNLLFVDITARAQHVVIAHAVDTQDARQVPPVLC